MFRGKHKIAVGKNNYAIDLAFQSPPQNASKSDLQNNAKRAAIEPV